jgi:hypothetical protein
MRKGFIVFLLVLLVLSVINVPVFAAESINETSDQISNKDVAHHTRESLKSQINSEEAKSGDYLIDDWYCEIREMDNGKVELYGWTQCNRNCEEVSVELQLQQWTGSSWTTLGTYEFAGFDTNYTWGKKNVSVTGKNSYRVKSRHYAQDGSVTDQTTAATEGIYVN